MAELTPMMKQYFSIKDNYMDCILFYRLGDFYEMFYDDAILASKELEITLTGRDCGQEERAPMCGVPFHSADSYIYKLINKGYKVAICEQVEDVSTAKGIVKRDVIRIVTPGTIMDEKMLDDKTNNFLAVIYKDIYGSGVAFGDVSTGELSSTEFVGDDFTLKLINEISRYMPSEIVGNLDFISDKAVIDEISSRFKTRIYSFNENAFETENAKAVLNRQFSSSVDFSGYSYAQRASGAMISYLNETQKGNISHLKDIKYYTTAEFMDLDIATRRNLEITQTMREKGKKGSFLWILDETDTSMGARLMRNYVEHPLLNEMMIIKRLAATEELKENLQIRKNIKELLGKIFDMERLIGKIVYGSANARDLISLKQSIAVLPEIYFNLSKCKSNLLTELTRDFEVLSDILELIEKAICDDPPFSVREGNLIKTGYNEEVDSLRSALTDGKSWLFKLETKERERTGIKKLKIGFNKGFGYYLEVSHGSTEMVPEDYIRKQTLANAERYITPELKELENKILGAEERIILLEYQIFTNVRESIMENAHRIQTVAKILATIDVFCSFAEVAGKYNYCQPDITAGDEIYIKDGRHPVVERVVSENMFVPNDTYLNCTDERLAIITGPNMAGKSTYMRQVALISLMAQIGSFVPAKEAKLSVVDKIFTRVGASDDLVSGQSTFMVEMNEVSNILNNANKKSLIILDEIGRGTSTYDGLSIAWAVTEHIADKKKIGAKTLFATHYHELTQLEEKLDGVKNYCVAVKKRGDDITFLRKIVKGGADDSFGIEVAKLAGVKESVIKRAKEILKSLEESDLDKAKSVNIKKIKKPDEIPDESIISFEDINAKKICEKLKNINIDVLTPIEAMNLIYQLKKEAGEL